MTSNPAQGLPFLPGNTFRDPTKSLYHRPQTLGYKNGYSLPRRPVVGIGRDPLIVTELTQAELDQLANQGPTLTYGQARPAPPEDFIPSHVAFDKKVLRFDGYFKQVITVSPGEEYRVRPVVFYYYLEDDSIAVVEPVVENSGIPQGKLIKRQQLPKNDQGEIYHWKDLNLGNEIIVYGTTYRLTSCDNFTQEYLESEGVIVNDPEETPCDPYSEGRVQPLRSYITPSDFDRLKQFLTMDRKVLRFYALWDYSDTLYGETRPVIIQYYLMDNSVEIREVHEPNNGRDPFPVLLRRQRLPRQTHPCSASFPTCVLEVSDQEVEEYYLPKDFKVGETMIVLGRRFLLYDCDEFTKNYYRDNFAESFTKVEVDKKDSNKVTKEIPPYNGFGSLEDTMQNCLSLIPQPPKKDFLKMLENDHKVLRYQARLDTQNGEDRQRIFILSYFLSNDMISIFEPPVRNSGIVGGKFLEKTRIPKPGCTIDNPVYYGPADFAIGTTVEVFAHRFILTDADEYVMKFLEANSKNIPSEVLNSMRQRESSATRST